MTISADTIPVLGSIGELGKSYSAWLVDIWGVMHNGVRAFPAAVEATKPLPRAGRHRRAALQLAAAERGLQHQLRGLGVTDQSYDATVSSAT